MYIMLLKLISNQMQYILYKKPYHTTMPTIQYCTNKLNMLLKLNYLIIVTLPVSTVPSSNFNK